MFRLILSSILVYATLGSALAQTEIRDSLDQEVVITYTKAPRSLKETSKPVVIITKEDIQRSSAMDVAQVLDAQSGIIVNGANGNPSLNKTTYIQGGSGENLLYLIDGMPVSDPSTIGGPFDIRSLDLSNIDRIEILKGSQSTIYGSNAIAGVVNIITNKASDKAISLSGQTAYATYGDFLQGLTLSGTAGDLSYRVAGQYQDASGISEAALPEGSTAEFDKDGSQRTNVSAHLSYQITDAVSVAPFYRYGTFDGEYDAGAFTDAENTYKTDFSQLGGRVSYASDRWHSYLDYSRTETDRVFNTSFGESAFGGTISHLDFYNDVKINDQNTLLLGVNIQNYSIVDANATPVNPEDDILSFYGQYQVSPTAEWNIEAGYRYNDHSRYGSNSTYDLATSYWITPSLKAQASYGTGFKAPLLSQLYGQWGANAKLQPQTSKYLQIGAEYYLSAKSSISAQYFDRKVDAIIIYQTDPQTFESQYVNLPSQATNGIELGANVDLTDALRLSANYTYLSGKTTEEANGKTEVTLKVLHRRPKHQLGGRLTYSPSDVWSAYLHVDNVGERNERFFDLTDFSSKDVLLDAYTRVSIGGSYRVIDQLTVSASINNLFDTEYQELWGYNVLGRHARLILHYQL